VEVVGVNRLYYFKDPPEFMTLEEIHDVMIPMNSGEGFKEKLFYYLFKFFGTLLIREFEICRYK